jgi:hypothetical protein
MRGFENRESEPSYLVLGGAIEKGDVLPPPAEMSTEVAW